MEISLDRLRVGKQAMVTRLDVGTQTACKLRAFGLIPGTKVRCRCKSPGGFVTALELRSSVLALRTSTMEKIWGATDE